MTPIRMVQMLLGGTASILGLVFWYLPRWLGLTGAGAWVLRGGLWVLVLVAAFLLFRFVRASAVRRADLRGDDPLVVAFRAARTRLGALSRPSGAKASLDALPVTLVVGPRGGTKTTLLANSGLDPELLAGEVYRGDLVAPTDVTNLWYAGDTVWVEAGGPLLEDAPRWERLGRLLRPRRLGAVLGRGAQPPRQVVVCLSCESFQLQGAAEAIPSTARALRDRLADLSLALGVRLPVYVFFTKADRIPHFAEFVKTLTRDEIRDFMGATFPLLERADPGTHAEREGARVAEALDGIARRLAGKRLSLLPRDPASAGAAYEFPREMRKLSGLATAFLVELCRPGQRVSGPFLRGFYFVGVRPVLVEAAAAAPPVAPAAGSGPVDATRVFRLQDVQGFQRPPTAPAVGGSRRVPQWLFHERVFRDVILADQVARAVTGGGSRVNLLRRVALGAGVLVSGALLVLTLASFFGNRALQGEARGAMEGVLGVTSVEPELPSLELLGRMDALRSIGSRLREYEQDSPPLRLRMGLYQGGRVLDEVRRVYFGALDRLVLQRAFTLIGGELAALPEVPDAASEYGRSYDALKAWLIMAGHPDRSTASFLTPVLRDRWLGGRSGSVDEAWLSLFDRQLNFYATELVVGDPYARSLDEGVVSGARRFLNQFGSGDRFYLALVTGVSEEVPSVRFAAVAPGTESVLTNPHEVPGAFTEAGWPRVQARLANIDQLLSQEAWVLGESTLSAVDRANLAAEVRERYILEYRAQWLRFLESATIQAGGGVGAVADRLTRMQGGQSPLLQLLALTAWNTAVDSVIAVAFDPVHRVTPPDVRAQLISDPNRPYVSALGQLSQILSSLAEPSPETGMEARGQQAARDVEREVQQLEQGFGILPEALPVRQTVLRILNRPVQIASAVIDQSPDVALNQGGASFCSGIVPILRKYPFTPGAGEDATAEDLAMAFEPGASLLWGFYQPPVSDRVVRLGNQYGAAAGTRVNPAFLSFFNKAMQISSAFYPQGGGREPSLQLRIRFQPGQGTDEITLVVDGRSETFTPSDTSFRTIGWSPRSRELRILGRVNGNQIPLLEVRQGVWSLFRFLQAGRWRDGTGGRFPVEWTATAGGVRLVGDVELGSTPPVMRDGFFQGFQCVGRITP
jgi:type VI secretion system protein ImpL